MSIAMLLLDAMIRFPTITLLILMGVLCWRDSKASQQCAIIAALTLSLGTMLLNTAPEILRPPEPAFTVMRIIDIPNIVLLWWFGLTLFDDEFRLGKLEWGVLCGVFAVVLSMRIIDMTGATDIPVALTITNRVLSFGMMAHLLWKAVSGRQDDLIEARRKIRLYFTIALALSCLIVVGAETYVSEIVGNTSDPQWLSTTRVAIIAPVVIWSALWFFQFRPELLKFEAVTKPTPKPAQVHPKDAATLTRLKAAMEQDSLHREHGLGIGDLAKRINVPEHQLRALINKGLGYRNFSAFLNTYRLAEAKATLSDAEQARTPILTIAMDAGYASLATFNRAFKSAEGVTPSEFRAAALASSSQN